MGEHAKPLPMPVAHEKHPPGRQSGDRAARELQVVAWSQSYVEVSYLNKLEADSRRRPTVPGPNGSTA